MAQINGPIISAILTAAVGRGGGVVLTAGTASEPTFRAAPPAAAGALTHGIVIRTPNANNLGSIGDVVSVQLLAGAILPVRVEAALAVGTACECMTDGRFGAAEATDERHAILLEASTAADQIVTALVGVFGRAP